MTQIFNKQGRAVSIHSERAAAVTKSDSTVFANPGILYIGGAGSGNLKVTTAGGDDIAFAGIAAGTVLPVIVKKVWSTGTDVTGIVLLF